MFTTFGIVTIALLLAGFLLVGIEMKLPGFGVPGIAGTICLILAVILTAQNFLEAMIMILGILAILGALLALVLRGFSKGKLFKPLILEAEQKKENGYISSKDLDYLLGKSGVAITDLRPAGAGDFEGVKLDVISDGEYITKGTPIQIFQVQGSRLVVKRIKIKEN